MHQLYTALKVLLDHCDGATSRDGQGFNAYDSPFARRVVGYYDDHGAFPYNSEILIYSMLKKYSRQLERNGVIYSDLKVPTEVGPLLIDWHNNLQKIKWGKPKIVEVNGKLTKIKNANIPQWFWDIWKSNKDDIKEAGYGVSYYKGEYKLAHYEAVDNKEVKKSNKLVIPNEFKYQDKLLSYQRDHVKHLIEVIAKNNGALDASDTGTGKTYSSIAVAAELGLFPIIITPKSVISSFEKVLKNHFQIEGYVNNYEQFRQGKTPYLNLNENEYHWNVPDNALIIFDEVHRCKNRDKTKNAKMLIQAREQMIKVLGLSATAGHTPLHYYAMGRVLDLFKTKGGFFGWCKNHGCYKGEYGFEFNGDSEHLIEINNQIFPSKGSRIRIDELGDLFPETQIISESYSMESSKKIDRIYAQMKKELTRLAIIKRKMDTNDQGQRLAVMQKARQEVELLKIPTIVEMTQDAIDEGLSVAIFVNYNKTVELLAQELETSCIISGHNKGNERDYNIQRFQDNEERVIICNIQAGGVGVSLHDIHGTHKRLSLISPDWSAENFKQALGRVHRAGGSKSIQKIVWCSDTIEEEICERVKTKLENMELINDGDLA